jgi:hypothetical protein
MDPIEEQNIWYPGLYQPRTDGDYGKKVGDVLVNVTIGLVQQRVKEDGEWLIANNRVGPLNVSEPLMRRMMEWVVNEKNIWQCIQHIGKDGLAGERTVDWVCRELAEASVMIRGSQASRN